MDCDGYARVALHEVEGRQIAVSIPDEDHLLKGNMPVVFGDVAVDVPAPVGLHRVQSFGQGQQVTDLVVVPDCALREQDRAVVTEGPLPAHDARESIGNGGGRGHLDEAGRQQMELNVQLRIDLMDRARDTIEHLRDTGIEL